VAVLAVLFFAHNWARVLEFFKRRWAYRTALVVLVVFTAGSFHDTFRPCEGEKSLGRWEDKTHLAPMARVVASLPDPVLVAGHPYPMGQVMIQARKPVLVIHRMFHHWFRDYRKTMDRRIRDTFRALYAKDVGEVNRLARIHGVTHLVVTKSNYDRSRFRTGNVYKREYNAYISRLARARGSFVLDPPPGDAVLFEDKLYWLVRLPIEKPAREKKAPARRKSGPAPGRDQ
jgi:hypothetical protein